ncbi:hypothetical protein I552_10194 [Mycobacterium xenopi 3993]|nr:hypothetical protein I552_10194 [Mycobacterium xenopi 3993]
MALKAAEAHALRRAFEVAGLPALDEQREPPTKHHTRADRSLTLVATPNSLRRKPPSRTAANG